MIERLLEQWGEVNLFTRPRRFGKTLNMSMLRSFLKSELLSLQTLSQPLQTKTIILINAYDMRLDKAFHHSYYKEMVSLI